MTLRLTDQRLRGVETPIITMADVEQAHVMYERETPLLQPYERADRLLRFLAVSGPMGWAIDFIRDEFFLPWTGSAVSNQDVSYQYDTLGRYYARALAWSDSDDEDHLEYLTNYLQGQGWISKGAELNGEHTRDLYLCRVEIPGYRHVEELETNPDSAQCFVAMWFDPSMEEVYEKGIKPAIEAVGYSPLRIDRQEFVGKIDDEIIAEIRRSRFLVADFTHGHDGARGGVYYEAGFAQGLGLTVIFTCRDDMFDNLHFDTRQFNHIAWENPDDLREKLANRIGSVMGDGPNRTN